MKRIFLTGATGFLGGEILVMLSGIVEIEKIYCLVRSNSSEEAIARLEHVFALHGDYFDRNKVIPVLGDMMDDFLGESLCALSELSDIDIIIHSAANTSFARMYDNVVKKVNIGGTNQILSWAKNLEKLETFVYVGTATICGKDMRNRVIHEDESPNEDAKQLVTYSYTKMMGEISVRRVIPGEKLLIVRPSIIMGDSRPVLPRSYVIMWAFAAFDLMRIIPMQKDAGLDIISVDYTASAIIKLLFSKRRYTVYNISAGEGSATTMDQIMKSLERNIGSPQFKFVPYEDVNKLRLWAKGRLENDDEFANENADYLKNIESRLGSKGNLRILLGALDAYYKFGNLGQIFDNTRMLEDAHIKAPEPADCYMARSKHLLANIDVLEGAIDP